MGVGYLLKPLRLGAVCNTCNGTTKRRFRPLLGLSKATKYMRIGALMHTLFESLLILLGSKFIDLLSQEIGLNCFLSSKNVQETSHR